MEADLFERWSTKQIINDIAGNVVSHLISHHRKYRLSANQVASLTHAMFALQSLPLFVCSLPYIFIEVQYTGATNSSQSYSLTFDEETIEFAKSGYTENELGGDSYSDEMLVISPAHWDELNLISILPNLESWRDAFLYAESAAQLSIQTDLKWYDENDLYNSIDSA